MLSSCTNQMDSVAFDEIIGQNPQLKQVLLAYSDDPQKREAAEYLIENLPYHYSLEGDALIDYLRLFELHGKHTLYPDQVLDSITKHYNPYRVATELKPKNDIYIDAGYLKENIDIAFKVWREQPWGKNVSYEMFRDYILPYRVGDEVLVPWRKEIFEKFNPLLDSIRNTPEAEDPLYVSQILMDSLIRGPINFTGLFSFGPHYGPKVVDWRSGSCRDFTDLQIYVFRALGIPCAEEFMINRGSGNVDHYWNAVFDKEGNTYYCSILDPTSELKDPTTMWDPKGKVYRRTFDINKTLLEYINLPLEDIHPNFRIPCFKDVTTIYSGKKNWTVVLDEKQLYKSSSKKSVFYLCSASQMQWVPIGVGRVRRGKAEFLDVEGEVVLRVASYENGMLSMQSDPFLLDRETGEIKFFPSGGDLKEVTLYNKYNLYFEPSIRLMEGGVFEGSNRKDFKEKDTLYVIPEMPHRLINTVDINSDKAYRYVRFVGSPESHCDISELAFYHHASKQKLEGLIIGTRKGIDQIHGIENVFDDDPYTSFSFVEADGGWVGLDLGKPEPIGRIQFTARNRDNYVRIGDSYELFHCDKGEWKSAGRTVAYSDSLVFYVPEGSLLYLKDHTRGKDERIFEYEDNRQVFW